MYAVTIRNTSTGPVLVPVHGGVRLRPGDIFAAVVPEDDMPCLADWLESPSGGVMLSWHWSGDPVWLRHRRSNLSVLHKADWPREGF